MGVFDLFRSDKREVADVRSALDEAREGEGRGNAVTRMVQGFVDAGIDGRGPAKSAAELAERARRRAGNDAEKAIEGLVGPALRGAAVGGFATSVGGFVTMPVAIPVNVAEFYLQATRMVAQVAHLRGYDLDDPEIRSAVLLVLSGQNADDLLAKVGVSAVAGGAVTSLLASQLPKQALMLLNKAIGFRILKSVGQRTLSRFGRAVPFLGGAVGAAVDWFLMRRIAAAAKREFPPVI